MVADLNDKDKAVLRQEGNGSTNVSIALQFLVERVWVYFATHPVSLHLIPRCLCLRLPCFMFDLYRSLGLLYGRTKCFTVQVSSLAWPDRPFFRNSTKSVYCSTPNRKTAGYWSETETWLNHTLQFLLPGYFASFR